MAININRIAGNALTPLNDWMDATFEIVIHTWETGARIPVERKKRKTHRIKLQPASPAMLRQYGDNLINSYNYFTFFIDAPVMIMSNLAKASHNTFKIDSRIYRIVGSTFIFDAMWSQGLCYLSDIE